MIIGKSVHKGAEKNFKQKIESKSDLKTNEVLDVVSTYYNDNAEEVEQYVDDGRNKKIAIGEEKDVAISRAKVHIEDFSPTIQPLYVEAKQEIIIPGIDKTFLGYIDLIDYLENIRDLKVTTKKKSKLDVDTDMQLTSYSLIYKALTGRDSNSVVFDSLTETKKDGIKVHSVAGQRTNQDYQRLINIIVSVHNCIKSGTFHPALQGSWWCSPKFCGYYRTCKFGGKP
jgi:hypothetical protein